MTEVILRELYTSANILCVCILIRLEMSKGTTIEFPKVVTSLTIVTSGVVSLIPFTTEKSTQLTCTKCNYNLTLLSLTTT